MFIYPIYNHNNQTRVLVPMQLQWNW